ncbi:MAG TPA: hypothetical protein VI685_05365 [Candidatus Angelobacter sp.]
MRAENHDSEEIRAELKKAFPAVNAELRRDLWPEMLRRLEKSPTKVPWYDWALAAGVVASTLLFPMLALCLFAYHL